MPVNFGEYMKSLREKQRLSLREVEGEAVFRMRILRR